MIGGLAAVQVVCGTVSPRPQAQNRLNKATLLPTFVQLNAIHIVEEGSVMEKCLC
jgi:hypothetical protein